MSRPRAERPERTEPGTRGPGPEALRRFDRRFRRLRARVETFPRDPRFNAFHWLHDCWLLAWQIEYSVERMRERAAARRQAAPAGSRPADADFETGYYADNAVVRLASFRDKLALCLWSYFTDFDPERSRADFWRVLEMLTAQNRLIGPGAQRALAVLRPLAEEPAILRDYRNQKIHRREPRVELSGVAPHHDAPYLVPLTTKRQWSAFDRRLAATYPDRGLRAWARERCTRDGVAYGTFRSERLFAYGELEAAIRGHRRACYAAALGALDFLVRRPPLRGLGRGA